MRAIEAPFIEKEAPPFSEVPASVFAQPYRYFGSGKQTTVFVSQDGHWVIKFFKKRYFQIPLFLRSFPNSIAKRKKRCSFYQESYPLAARELKEETAIVYLHMGPSEGLPLLALRDRWGIRHRIDLNQIPFVVQRKADPFCSMLTTSSARKMITAFLTYIAHRMEKGIGDGDHEMEGNFGIVDGRVVQLDPGRLYFDERLEETAEQEWWRATHRLRKWLLVHASDSVPFFDEALAAAQRWQRPLDSMRPDPVTP